MKRRIRVAMRIMFNDPDGMKLFVKWPLGGGKKEAISYYLIQVEYWITGKIYYSLDFPSYYLEDAPDFSIKEILYEKKI